MSNNIDWKKIDSYQQSVVMTIKGRKMRRACIFCEAEDNINIQALWVDDERERAITYFLCKHCSENFFKLPKPDRQAIVTNFIEKKIDAMMTPPRLKMSQAVKAGFEIDF